MPKTINRRTILTTFLVVIPAITVIFGVIILNKMPSHSRQDTQETTNASTTVSPAITKERAEELVRSLPEVKADQERLSLAGDTLYVEIESDNFVESENAWLVHVYAINVYGEPQAGITSNTVTFNWYYVDKDTGSIRKMF